MLTSKKSQKTRWMERSLIYYPIKQSTADTYVSFSRDEIPLHVIGFKVSTNYEPVELLQFCRGSVESSFIRGPFNERCLDTDTVIIL